MNTEERNKIDNFIELFKNFKQKQQQQKLRGKEVCFWIYF